MFHHKLCLFPIQMRAEALRATSSFQSQLSLELEASMSCVSISKVRQHTSNLLCFFIMAIIMLIEQPCNPDLRRKFTCLWQASTDMTPKYAYILLPHQFLLLL